MKKYDATIIIHGPVDPHTVISVYRYCESYNIVVVCPKPKKDYIFDEIIRLSKLENRNISTIVYDESVKKNYNNNQNRYYHYFSVDCALKLCNTEYAIKLRSDEFYSNLDVFYDRVISNESKIVTNDIFFRNSARYKLHPSDHLVGGRTDLLSKVYSQARKMCERSQDYLDSPIMLKEGLSVDSICPEQVLGISVVTQIHQKETLDKLDCVDLMKSSFEIVRSSNLGSFVVTANSQGKQFTDTSYIDYEQDVINIEKYA